MAAFASRYAHGPTRVQFEAKNPRGFAIFKQALAGHSALVPSTPSSAAKRSVRRYIICKMRWPASRSRR